MHTMDQLFQTLFPYAMTVLGVVLTIMLNNLLKAITQNKIENQKLRMDINDILLSLAKLTPTLMSAEACARVRGDCLQLNKRIILEPLERKLDDMSRDRDERWEQQEQENRDLWGSILSHAHSDNGVVMAPRAKKT
jgi:hypothetical protein